MQRGKNAKQRRASKFSNTAISSHRKMVILRPDDMSLSDDDNVDYDMKHEGKNITHWNKKRKEEAEDVKEQSQQNERTSEAYNNST